MSAIPIRQERRDIPSLCILEVCNTGNTLDLYSDRLSLQGYEVLSASNYDDAIKLAQQCKPALIVAYDDPATNIDAVEWLQRQHTDKNPELAMTPLLILADSHRVLELREQELPDRVVVLQRRLDTLNQLTRTVRRLLQVWQMQ
jgi:response regulator RpfG family c-di-GMP phosphodiesterase